MQHKFAVNILDTFNRNIIPISLQSDNRTVNRGLFNGPTERTTYATDINLNGQFDLFLTRHNILIGFDYFRFEESRTATFLASAPFVSPIDMFNPVYGTTRVPSDLQRNVFFNQENEWFGLYFQDQIDFTRNVHFLFSGRQDWVRTASGFSPVTSPELSSVSSKKFSPRIGLLYQPFNSSPYTQLLDFM